MVKLASHPRELRLRPVTAEILKGVEGAARS